MWPGVEPQRGQYNATYINVMKQLVETLQRYDIFVLLDCHQDLLSPKFCGEGVPDFAAIVGTVIFPLKGNNTHSPLPTLKLLQKNIKYDYSDILILIRPFNA